MKILLKILRSVILFTAGALILLTCLGQLDSWGLASLGLDMQSLELMAADYSTNLNDYVGWVVIFGSRLALIMAITFLAFFFYSAVTIWSKGNPKD